MPSVRAAFLQGKLREFLPYGCEDLPTLLATPRPAPRREISSALVSYLKRMGAPEESLTAARRLAHPRSRAIVTGQQAGLLTGPAFTFYKAHTALKLAERHDREDRPVEAVFWIASQDHDVQEVSWMVLLGFDERIQTLELNMPEGRPVGRVDFSPYRREVTEFLERFGGVTSIRRTLIEAMEAGGSYAEVFARQILGFLGRRGLVVLDPLAPELAPFFTGLLERELEDPLASASVVNAAAEDLQTRGFEPALTRGRGATNLFLEDETGRRRLLRFEDGHFDDGNRHYSAGELKALLRVAPDRLTPAAGLRPVAQDSVLPTVGFVVGPGEMAYVAELGGVYRLHGLPMPAVVDRLHGVVAEPPVSRILRRFGLEAWAFTEDPESRIAEVVEERSHAARRLDESVHRVEEEFTRALAAVPRLDATLQGALLRGQGRVQREIERLREKILLAELRTNRVIRGQYERLTTHLLPLGRPQERVLPMPGFLLKHGEELLTQLAECPIRGRVQVEV